MRMYRTIAVSFLLLLVASPVIISLFSHIHTAVIRHEMLERLEKEQLVTLHLKPSEIHWYKANKELLIGSDLFDVKSISGTKEGFIVSGLFDKKEKELKRNIEDLAKRSGKQKNQRLLSFFSMVFHQEKAVNINISYDLAPQEFNFFSEMITDNSYPVIVPPPKSSLVF